MFYPEVPIITEKQICSMLPNPASDCSFGLLKGSNGTKSYSYLTINTGRDKWNLGGFHLLHLLNFPFVYHFYSRMTNLVELTCCNPAQLFIFKQFQNILIRCSTQNRNAASTPISFEVKQNGNSNDNIQSFGLSFKLLRGLISQSPATVLVAN